MAEHSTFVFTVLRESIRVVPRRLISLPASITFFSLLSVSLYCQTSHPAASDFSTLAAQADAARDAERLEDALALYRKALALRPSWAEGWWSVGTIEYDRNAYPEAARAFRKLITVAPKNGTGFVMLGLTEFELGEDEPALEHIQKGTQLGMDKDASLRHSVLYHQGVLLQRKGRFEAAQKTLGQLCLEGAPDDQLELAMGMVALRLQTKDVASEPSASPGVVQEVGHAACLSFQKKFEEARQAYSVLAKDHPTYPNLHYAFGKSLLDANDTAAAIDQFQQEIKNNPKDVVARLQIAAAKYKIDSAAGVPYAEEAVAIDPQLPFAHYLLGLLQLDSDNFQKAIPELEVASRSFPRDAKLFFALSSAYARSGRKQDAARARARFLQLNQAQSGQPQGSAGLQDAPNAGMDAHPPE